MEELNLPDSEEDDLSSGKLRAVIALLCLANANNSSSHMVLTQTHSAYVVHG